MIGNKTKAVEDFWQDCRSKLGIVEENYFAGTFADPIMAPYHDELIDLVAEGRKRATAHLDLEFDLNSIARRKPGDYWVVLDSINMPKYLVQITDVATTPFNEVLLSFAEREGEGDYSLEYWQKVHREYFQAQCEVWGKDWSESLNTVCEGFELLMSANQANT